MTKIEPAKIYVYDLSEDAPRVLVKSLPATRKYSGGWTSVTYELRKCDFLSAIEGIEKNEALVEKMQSFHIGEIDRLLSGEKSGSLPDFLVEIRGYFPRLSDDAFSMLLPENWGPLFAHCSRSSDGMKEKESNGEVIYVPLA